ncbi:MAG TPA: carboxypeptidase-like regulatory domain-containing protein [Prolixibacteraceae bacterium]|nr:carboxypeptidase-like regulatory domain-containing protein [Prolixibacteraceae bacterium]
MKTILLLVLLQFKLFGSSDEPLQGAKIYIENASSQEIIAFSKIGFSGEFEFSNLDPGNYYIAIEIPANTVREVDNKTRQKFDTDIVIAYNKNKKAYCWQRADGYLKMVINKESKIANAYIPVFSVSDDINQCEGENENEKDKTFFDKLAKKVKKSAEIPQGKFYIMQFTVVGQFGKISGELLSISQRSFHGLTVGNKDITLEEMGDVEVLQRIE